MLTSVFKKTILLPLLVALYSSTEGARVYSLDEDFNSITTGSLDWSEGSSGGYSADSDVISGSGSSSSIDGDNEYESLGYGYDGSDAADDWASSSSDTGCDDAVSEKSSGSGDDDDYDVAEGWSTRA